MVVSDKKENLDTLFERLFQVISSERFLKREGLGNEVPFFISPYHASLQNRIDIHTASLCKRLNSHGVYVLEINLYDLAIELLKQEGDFDLIIKKETVWEKGELKQQLQQLLDVEEFLVPAIAEKMAQADFNVLFITGVGLVFPYIRSHNVLNNLQKVATRQPTVLFFPGDYTHSMEYGSSLDLFGLLRDDKYYRAFNINHFTV